MEAGDPSPSADHASLFHPDGYFSRHHSSTPMAVDNETVTRLLQQLEADRKAYLASVEKIHDVLARALAVQPQPDRTEFNPTPPSLANLAAPSRSLTLASFEKAPLSPNLPPSIGSSRKNPSSSVYLDGKKGATGSIFTGDDSSDSDDDESFFAQETLPAREFNEDDLLVHLQTHEWDKYSLFILQDLLRNLELLANGIFIKERHLQHTDANHHHADIYHVGTDGAPLRHSRGDSDEGPLAIWEALRSVNCDEDRKQAVGRIVVVREPPSSLFAALHLTMKEHFDMDAIYRILIDDHTPTMAITKGYLKKDHRRQRSIAFVFKYHTLVGEGRAPLPWQSHDDVMDRREGHVPLSTCSSVVALSLAGRPSHTLRRNSRKSKSIVGYVFDPFAPWYVLNIQLFPDWHSSVDAHETNHHYVNGPDAFLATLLSEYRDAVKRFKAVHKSIMDLATPPNRSIFDSSMRDELLFENDKYTYSRRYFWASQTLGLLSNEIKAMIIAYRETFTEEVWAGEHKTLFPGTKDQSSRYSNWRKKLLHTRKQFEKVISQLEEVLQIFQAQQKEIRGLREWLFSGTSVLESREAVNQARITVDQGYNIRLLTLVTLFFLPLTFVTSIYGMTNMPPEDSFWPFGLTAVGICAPTYLIILMANNPEKLQYLHNRLALIFSRTFWRNRPEKAEKIKEKILDQEQKKPNSKKPLVRRAATHASLDPRLSADLVLEANGLRHHSAAFLKTSTQRMSHSISSHLPGLSHSVHGASRRMSSVLKQSTSLPTYAEEPEHVQLQERSSTVKFEEPEFKRKPSDGTTIGREQTNETFVSASPGTMPAPPKRAATMGPTMVEEEISFRDMSKAGNKSLFRRVSERFSPLQNSPRTPDSGTASPKTEV